MKKIAFISASWHENIVNICRDSFTTEMHKLGTNDIDFFQVPGSLEIPLKAKTLAKSGNYDAIVASGLIVDGGIYRHDFVANAVLNGIMKTQLNTEVPILSAVLTPHHFHEHKTHENFYKEHMQIKGIEVAQACTEILKNNEIAQS
jgi:6,7-dimethyl-8-ribityllumazine synthase